MNPKSLRALSGPEKTALEGWRKGGPIDKQGISILILSGLVLLIGILLGLKTIAADLLH
jgi:hypothetical protein